MTKEEMAQIQKMLRDSDYHRVMEVRSHTEKRVDEDNKEHEDMIIEGVPIVYDSKTELFRFKRDWSDGKEVIYEEIIHQGAVDDKTRSDNCFMKFNHSDDVFPVARVRNKSLILESKEDGVHMRARIANTATGKELYQLVEEGILDRMSFAFVIDRGDNGSVITSVEDDEKVVVTREINHIAELYDVAAVMVPAYEATSLHARCKEDVETYLKQVEADERAAAEAARIEEIRKETHELIDSANPKL